VDEGVRAGGGRSGVAFDRVGDVEATTHASGDLMLLGGRRERDGHAGELSGIDV
jgi:hypothetical protein